MLTNHIKINLNSNLSLNGASRTSILPCASFILCESILSYGGFSSIKWGSKRWTV
jgi:hypothetical protein